MRETARTVPGCIRPRSRNTRQSARLQELKGIDCFLGTGDQDQLVAKAAGMLQAFDGSVKGDDAGSQGAIGLSDPGRRRLEPCLGLVHLFGHLVLGVAKVDDRPRLSPRWALIRARLPMPKFSTCQTS